MVKECGKPLSTWLTYVELDAAGKSDNLTKQVKPNRQFDTPERLGFTSISHREEYTCFLIS